MSSTRIKDAGIAIRHSRRYTFPILQGLEMGWRGWTWCVREHKNKLTLRKRHFVVIGNYIEGVKQDEKHVLDLVESIMKGSGLVKEELRRISSQMGQYRPKTIKIKVSTFWMSGKIPDSRRRLPAAAK